LAFSDQVSSPVKIKYLCSRARVVLWLASSLLLTACGGGSGNSASTDANLAGNWQITLQRQQSTTSKSESGFFVQSGNSISGTLLLTGDTDCAGIGSVQGQIDGTNVTISVSQVGQTVNLTGSVGTAGSASLNGNYSILASPCGSTQVGTWSATEVQALTGSFQAVFTSTDTSGVIFQSSGSLSEGPNTGSSFANLSGNMKSNDAACFSSANISGSISGTSVVLNLMSSEGVALGQIHGTTNTKANTITGVYDFLNPETPPLSGCQDFGTITVTMGS
jgi:hypothetical protein